jgi:6-pyruvoyltetrahydropterin/6-carboxytetrahydropterin synthase
MFELRMQFKFEAAHTLKRKIAAEGSRRIHGHSYKAEVAIRGTPDPETGMLIDLGFFSRQLHSIAEKLDHHFLDEIDDLGPATLENLAVWIWGDLMKQGTDAYSVTVARESGGDSCIYVPSQA